MPSPRCRDYGDVPVPCKRPSQAFGYQETPSLGRGPEALSPLETAKLGSCEGADCLFSSTDALQTLCRQPGWAVQYGAQKPGFTPLTMNVSRTGKVVRSEVDSRCPSESQPLCPGGCQDLGLVGEETASVLAWVLTLRKHHPRTWRPLGNLSFLETGSVYLCSCRGGPRSRVMESGGRGSREQQFPSHPAQGSQLVTLENIRGDGDSRSPCGSDSNLGRDHGDRADREQQLHWTAALPSQPW